MSDLPGDWICPNCGPILNACVTYQETCTHCHYPVFWVDEVHELVKKCDLTQAKARIEELEGLVKKSILLGVSGDGTCWFCGFCGAHGSAKVHYDNCFAEAVEVKAIMEKKDA